MGLCIVEWRRIRDIRVLNAQRILSQTKILTTIDAEVNFSDSLFIYVILYINPILQYTHINFEFYFIYALTYTSIILYSSINITKLDLFFFFFKPISRNLGIRSPSTDTDSANRDEARITRAS